MISISDFCDKHNACKDGRGWAMSNCTDMQDAWEKLKPNWLLWVATRRGVLTDKELRLFAVFCARQVEHLITDQRSKDAINVAERFANGQSTAEELAAANAAANAASWEAMAAAMAASWDASWDASWAASWAAARAAANAAANAAAREAMAAARDASWDASWAASWDAANAAAREARVAARDASWDAARDAQAAWLRENTKPRFEVTEGMQSDERN